MVHFFINYLSLGSLEKKICNGEIFQTKCVRHIYSFYTFVCYTNMLVKIMEKVEVYYLGEVCESVSVYLTYTHNIAQQDIKKMW